MSVTPFSQPVGLLTGCYLRLCLFLLAVNLLAAGPTRAEEFMAGLDISALPSLEAAGARYYQDGEQEDAIEIFANKGANWARIRLFVNPSGQNVQDQDLAYTIALAQRAKAADMKVLLDLHYSDTWADPGKQYKPAAWESLGFEALKQQVYDYTRDVVEEFDAADVLPEMVQVGNEISNGMLWPDGKVSTNGYANLADLLSAGINGVRDAAPDNKPQIMIHHDRGSVWSQTSGYFNNLIPELDNNGTDFDVIGYSYYPRYHPGGIAGLQQNLNNSAAVFDKPVVVVEAGYVASGTDKTAGGGQPEFEFSPAGQKAYLQAVVDAVKAVPDNKGLGVFWWYPEATTVGVSDLHIWEGGRLGLFDQSTGEIRPAIDVFSTLGPAPFDSTQVLYREEFSTLGGAELSDIGWSDSHAGGNGNSAGTFDGANGDAIWWWNSTPLSDDTTVIGALTTDEIGQIPVDAPNLTFSWQQRLERVYNDDFDGDYYQSGDPIDVRLAVEVDGVWYASAESYFTGSAGVGDSGDWRQHDLEFDPSAANWVYLTLDGEGASLGAVASADLEGAIEGLGLVAAFTRYQTLNFNFLTATTAAAGDFNKDGVVDVADYTVWRDGLGDVFEQSHYIEWRDNFGRVYPLVASPLGVAAPEASALCVLGWGVAVSLLSRF